MKNPVILGFSLSSGKKTIQWIKELLDLPKLPFIHLYLCFEVSVQGKL